MGLHGKLLQITLPGVMIIAIAVVAAAQAKQNCPDKCGNLYIPYPFGMFEGCYLNKNYMVTCDFGKPKVGSVFVQGISLGTHELRALQTVARDCYNASGQLEKKINSSLPEAPQFVISGKKNKLTVVGCDTTGYLHGFQQGQPYLVGCSSGCPSNSNVIDGSCSGVGCCQAVIPDGLTNVSVEVKSFLNHTVVHRFNPCGYAFAVNKDEFNFSSNYLKDPPNETVPVVLQWAVGDETCEKAQKKPSFACRGNTTDCENVKGGVGYRCICKRGYEGNPYLPGGCEDINECRDSRLNNCTAIQKCHNTNGSYTCLCPKWLRPKGKKPGRSCVPGPGLTATISIVTSVSFVASLRVSWRLYLGHQKRNKRKFYDENGGSDLENELRDQAKIYTLEELKKATKNFDKSRIIGPGGFGSFYKGILPDGTTVAIKKSKAVNQSQKEQFIEEVVALSHIKHKNIVKLLGCCLEKAVPLLVYEFVSNNTLFEYIHNGSKPSPISDMENPPEEGLWKSRIKIAWEVADALSNLHSATSKPIIHRNVKSANILLKYEITMDDITANDIIANDITASNITTNVIIAKVSDFGISRLFPQDQKELVQEILEYLDPEYLQTNQLTKKSDVYSFGVVLIELLTGKEAFSKDSYEDERSLVRYFLSYLKHDQPFEVLDKDIVVEGNEEQITKVIELAKRCLKVKGDERPTMEEVATELKSIRNMKTNPLDDPQSNEQEPEQSPGETEETNEDDGSGGGTDE